MKERPMPFSAPMVRALFDDTKTKTQTRHIVKDTDVRDVGVFAVAAYVTSCAVKERGRVVGRRDVTKTCPYGVPGDRLWVKETFATPALGVVQYRADGARGAWIGDGGGGRIWIHHGWTLGISCADRVGVWSSPPQRWRPSNHMPRWASRIDLEITAVRVERLQEISEEDAKAEGAHMYVAGHGPITDRDLMAEPGYWSPFLYRNGYEDLWESINGRESWEANPWVWVISFRRVKP